MKKNYNLAGPERKALIKKIEEFTGEKSKYLGTPTYSYQVGNFNVSRYGELSCESDADENAEKLVNWLSISGFTPEGGEMMEETTEENQAEITVPTEEPTEEMNTEESAADVETEAFEPEETEAISEPEPVIEDAEELQKKEDDALISDHSENQATECEEEISDEVEHQHPEPEDTEDKSSEEEGADDDNQLTISFSDDLTDEQFEILTKVVESKATLLKHAFKSDSLEIKREDGKINFPWFVTSDGDHANAYIIFLQKLEDFAKEAKRVTAQDHAVSNEKYAFRTWLLRLGMIGPEYKGCRKILLENLTGSSAFRDGKKKKVSAEEDQEVSA